MTIISIFWRKSLLKTFHRKLEGPCLQNYCNQLISFDNFHRKFSSNWGNELNQLDLMQSQREFQKAAQKKVN